MDKKDAVITTEEPVIVEKETVVKEPEKKGLNFPSAFTVLFIVLLLATILTWIVPAGKFKTLQYNSDADVFTITDKLGNETEEPATAEVLKKYNIPATLESFKDGKVTKPMAMPGTYERIESNPQNFFDFITSPVKGIVDSIEIIVFVLILGGVIGLVNASGAFDAGMNALGKVIKGKEFLLIVILFILITAGGSTFGLAEETIAFYPILMPIFLASGFDAITAIATIYMGSCIGTMFSTTNPFSVIVASDAAGIDFSRATTFRLIALVIASLITLAYIWFYIRRVKKDEKRSLVYDQKEEIHNRFLKGAAEVPEFTLRRKLILAIFILAFPVMIYMVSSKGWYFTEMTALFLFVGLLLMFLSGLGEKKAVGTFLDGAADLVSVALIIGIARAINIIMDDGMISDTMLNTTANAVHGMNGLLFVSMLFVLFSVLGLFIPSSSGLASLSMPIVAPLADTVNMARDTVVSAYNWGQGWMAFITPTGLILATLEMVGVTYDRWLKFIMPLMGILGVYSIVMLYIHSLVIR